MWVAPQHLGVVSGMQTASRIQDLEYRKVYGRSMCDTVFARPVMSILKFSTTEEAIKRANDTIYGQ